MIVDLDATLVTAHSEKEDAAPTYKRGFGFHPLCAFVDHSSEGTGEPLAIELRAGNAGANTAADHITVLNFGRRIADGTPREVLTNPDVIAAYQGDPAARSVGRGATRSFNNRCRWSADGASTAA